MIKTGQFHPNAIQQLYIPSNIVVIQSDTFRGWKGLTSVSFNRMAQLTFIRAGAFAQTGIKTLVLPPTVTILQHEAFYGCADLKRVKISEGLREVGDVLTADRNERCGVFEDSGVELVMLPSTLQTLHYRTFRNCMALAEITLPPGLERIGKMCFQGSGLRTVTIPWTVVEIDELAFEGCSALESVHIECGSMLETVGESVFANCKSLKTAYVPRNVQVDVLVVTELVLLPDAGTLVAGRCLADYREMRDVVLPGGLKAIRSGWFAKSRVCSVEIPSSVTVVEDYAFAGCTSLVWVEFCGQSQVRSIGKRAFAETALEEFAVPPRCAALAELAFWKCAQLVRVKLNSGLKTIGQECFAGCGLAGLVVPNSVLEIGARAFGNCREL